MMYSRAGWKSTPHLPLWANQGESRPSKEARPGGVGYWYAYRTQDRHTRKRYLGPSAKVTLARLEQGALELSRSPSDHRAATGSGKTTLLSAWVTASPQVLPRGETKQSAEPRGSEPAFAWLSLDEPDNDPIRFWLSVIAALRTCQPTCGEVARELLHSPQAPPLSTILTTLLDEVEQVDRELILILDDFHVISDQAIHESLLALLNHPPAHLHLVLSTRTNPALPLSRFRVRSQMVEIRDQDLRFTRQEAANFLVEGMGLPLSGEDVVTLAARDALLAPTHKTLSHTPQNAVQGGPIEPLSRREQRVLRLLVAGRTDAEMAQELIVSPNMVKTQISSIYRKLGVSRRAEAIAMASRLHLL